MVRTRTGIFAAMMLGAVAVIGAQQPQDKPAQPAPTVGVEQSQQRPAEPAPTTGAQDKPAQQKPAPSAEAKAGTVTVQGCLKSGAAPGSWILTDASTASSAPAGEKPAPTTGGAGTRSYNVVAKTSEDISKHANHKIEVTGMVAPASSASAPPPPAGGSPSASTQPKETLTVTSFKMVSATCP